MEKIAKPTNGKLTNGKAVFDPKMFLATVNHGRTVTMLQRLRTQHEDTACVEVWPRWPAFQWH